MILKNAVRCKKCGEIIESASIHDFKWCKCGAVAVDGGRDYLRRSANSLEDFEELSIVIKDNDIGDGSDTNETKQNP